MRKLEKEKGVSPRQRRKPQPGHQALRNPREEAPPWQDGQEVSFASDLVKLRGFGMLVFKKASTHSFWLLMNKPFCGEGEEKSFVYFRGMEVWRMFHRETLREGYR